VPHDFDDHNIQDGSKIYDTYGGYTRWLELQVHDLRKWEHIHKSPAHSVIFVSHRPVSKKNTLKKSKKGQLLKMMGELLPCPLGPSLSIMITMSVRGV